MRLSANGLKLLKELEGGFRSKAYKDAKGYSIGYGHFILPSETRLRVTEINESVASVMLKSDVLKAVNYVNGKKLTLNQNQFDSLVIFVYNVGSWKDGFDNLIKASKYSLLPAKWREYNISDGLINKDLISRREKEIALFLTASLPFNPFLAVTFLILFFFIR